ncbi:MAG TPA: ribose-5-phosphate isomerase RpiA [Terriglobales bacterium]|nr:ribose-5-phosphate isomerase RpiA [Terriglobales bacterium]
MSTDQEKQAAARASLKFIQEGNVVGLGSGSTAAYFIRFLGERVQAGLKICGVPTSVDAQRLAQSCGIPLISLDEVDHIDVDVDGADEFDPQLRLIKGGGGALLREKIVASASRKFVVVADSAKQVPMLGRFPLPVEVIPFAETLLTRRITVLGATVTLRTTAAGVPYKTDEGHHILDCHFGEIPDPALLARTLEGMPGIVEHGLFIDLATLVLVGRGTEVVEFERRP